jgi:hypothetical protein
LAVHGRHVPTGRITDDHIRQAFEVSRDEMRADAGPSTISVTGILSNVANKSALAAYASVPTTWQSFCRTVDLRDFKSATQYRLTGSGKFNLVPSGGKLEHTSLQEDSFSVQADTFGSLIGIDRRQLINDDLGMFAQVPKILGRQGAIALEKGVYSVLIANAGSFFGTTNKNLSTGMGSALSLAGLNAAYKLAQQQLDDNGDPILVTPTILLTPPALAPTARSLINSTEVIQGTATDLRPSGNEWANMFQPISSPFLAVSTGLSGASDAAWYLLMPGDDYAAVQVGFLNGIAVPTIQSGIMDFDTLGISMRAYHDFGVNFFDFRGGVLSAGS